MNTNFSCSIHHFWILLLHILHITFVIGHPHKTCPVVFASTLRKRHNRSSVTFILKIFALVAKALTFTTLKVFICQIFFHRTLRWPVLKHSPLSINRISFCKWYALLTVNSPFDLALQIGTSLLLMEPIWSNVEHVPH